MSFEICLQKYIHHHNQNKENITLRHAKTSILLHSLQSLHVLGSHRVAGIFENFMLMEQFDMHLFFGLTSLIKHNYLMFIHVFLCISSSFLFITGQRSFLRMYCNLFIYSSVHGHLGCVQCRAMTEKAAMSIGVPVDTYFYFS